MTKHEIEETLEILELFALRLIERGHNWDDEAEDERRFNVVVDRLKLALEEFKQDEQIN